MLVNEDTNECQLLDKTMREDATVCRQKKDGG